MRTTLGFRWFYLYCTSLVESISRQVFMIVDPQVRLTTLQHNSLQQLAALKTPCCCLVGSGGSSTAGLHPLCPTATPLRFVFTSMDGVVKKKVSGTLNLHLMLSPTAHHHCQCCDPQWV